MICPKCGSSEMEKMLTKGIQFRCRVCGYRGPMSGDFS